MIEYGTENHAEWINDFSQHDSRPRRASLVLISKIIGLQDKNKTRAPTLVELKDIVIP